MNSYNELRTDIPPGERGNIGAWSQLGYSIGSMLNNLKVSEKRTIKMCISILMMGLIANNGIKPLMQTYKKVEHQKSTMAFHQKRIDDSKIPVDPVNPELVRKAQEAENLASGAEREAQIREQKFAAGPTLPSEIAKAGGNHLVGTSADGRGYPIMLSNGKWLHRVETRLVASSWSDLMEAAKASEKATGPTSIPLALDLGRTTDGRFAFRAEWAVMGVTRDWIGENNETD